MRKPGMLWIKKDTWMKSRLILKGRWIEFYVSLFHPILIFWICPIKLHHVSHCQPSKCLAHYFKFSTLTHIWYDGHQTHGIPTDVYCTSARVWMCETIWQWKGLMIWLLKHPPPKTLVTTIRYSMCQSWTWKVNSYCLSWTMVCYFLWFR